MVVALNPAAAKVDADETRGQSASVGLLPFYGPDTEGAVRGAIGDERVLGSLHSWWLFPGRMHWTPCKLASL